MVVLKEPSVTQNPGGGLGGGFLTFLVKTDRTTPAATKSSLRGRYSRARRVTFGESVIFDIFVNFDTFGG